VGKNSGMMSGMFPRGSVLAAIDLGTDIECVASLSSKVLADREDAL
jgi:hypothetical protein